MKILAIYNLKGGVGKSSTAVNIAYLASKEGHKTLLWDLDPQGASSWYFEAENLVRVKAKKIFKQKLPLCKLVQSTSYKNLSIIPADINFGTIEGQLDTSKDDASLSKVLEPLKENYSLLILDCPPGLTRLTQNVFYAMDAILLPMIPTWLSLRSYEQLRLFLRKKNLSHKQIYPFFSMLDSRKKLHQDWLKMPPVVIEKLLKSHVAYSTVVEKMGEHKLPVELFAQQTNIALSYRNLWKEIQLKLKLKLWV